MKVKMLCSFNYETLEKEINDFIEEIEKQHMEVKDIKFTYSSRYGVLVIYGPQLDMRIEQTDEGISWSLYE